ncbi:MAG: helix-hairpin-helix domain-containing protein [Planctomycetota bacterium]
MPHQAEQPGPGHARHALAVLAAVWLLVGGLWLTTQRPPVGTAAIEPSLRIDINTAEAADLRLLPGVGPRLAENVIAHRTAHGPFAAPADLEAVPRIGPVLRRRLTPWATFSSPSAAPPDAAAAAPR